MGTFNEKINEQMRAGKGQRVGGAQMPEEHREINRFLREGAAKNTFETTLDGTITHVNGDPVSGDER